MVTTQLHMCNQVLWTVYDRRAEDSSSLRVNKKVSLKGRCCSMKIDWARQLALDSTHNAASPTFSIPLAISFIVCCTQSHSTEYTLSYFQGQNRTPPHRKKMLNSSSFLFVRMQMVWGRVLGSITYPFQHVCHNHHTKYCRATQT